MTINSKRERDRLAQEQTKRLEEAHRNRMRELEEQETLWATHDAEVLRRTTRDVPVDITHIQFEND